MTLRFDNDRLELANGRTLRLRLERDEYARIEDNTDWYGHFKWTRNNDLGRVRPAEFDGSARVIDWERGSSLWWMPPADVKQDAEATKRLLKNVAEILACGFSVYILEECEGVDAYGRPIVINVASVGGVEPTYNVGDVDNIVADLMTQLGYN